MMKLRQEVQRGKLTPKAYSSRLEKAMKRDECLERALGELGDARGIAAVRARIKETVAEIEATKAA